MNNKQFLEYVTLETIHVCVDTSERYLKSNFIGFSTWLIERKEDAIIGLCYVIE